MVSTEAQCPACGYSLRGLPAAGRCPECGFSYDAHLWTRFIPRPFLGHGHLYLPPLLVAIATTFVMAAFFFCGCFLIPLFLAIALWWSWSVADRVATWHYSLLLVESRGDGSVGLPDPTIRSLRRVYFIEGLVSIVLAIALGAVAYYVLVLSGCPVAGPS